MAQLSNFNGICPEEITFPTPQQSFVVQGIADTETEGESVTQSTDFYVIEIPKNSEVKLSLRSSHRTVQQITLLQITENWYNCEPSTQNPYISGHDYFIYDNVNQCFVEGTYSIQKGYYIVAITHSTFQTSLGCDLVEYQMTIENLGSYNPGGSCNFAHEITPKPTFAESQIPANLSDGELSNEMGCLQGSNEQRSMWFKFTATHENMFVMARRNGTTTLNAAIAVYDDCLGEPIFCQDAYAGGVNEVVIINNTIIGHEYYFRVYHNGQGSLNNGNIFASVAHVPTTTLIPSDCGRTGLLASSVIRSAWPVNQFLLSNWMYKFQETSPPYNVYEVLSPNGTNPNFRMSWFPQVQAGKTYIVWVRPKMYQGPTWADYGAPCMISMAPAASGMIANDGDNTINRSNTSGLGQGSIILDVWPNPAQDEVTLRFNANEGDDFADISIVDVSGKQVDHIYRTFEGGDIQTLKYTTEKLMTGIYLIQVRTSTGSTVAKLAVSH